jgi:hypothetical protein
LKRPNAEKAFFCRKGGVMKDRGMILIHCSSGCFRVAEHSRPVAMADCCYCPGPCWPHKIVKQSISPLRPLVGSRTGGFQPGPATVYCHISNQIQQHPQIAIALFHIVLKLTPLEEDGGRNPVQKS